MDRDYLSARGGWNGGGIQLLSQESEGWGEETVLESGVYPYAYPLITSLNTAYYEQDQLMVFLDTDPQDPSAQNSTRLYYTVYSNGQWSQPQQVDDDGTNDDTPNLFDLGDQVLVVWSSADQPVSPTDNPVDVMNSRNIKARFFDKSAMEWGPVTYITTTTPADRTGDSTPSIAYCEGEDGQRWLMVTYVKAAYQSTGEDEDVLVGDLLEPISTLAYRFYDFDNQQWVAEYNSAAMDGLRARLSTEGAEQFQENWYGQGFVDLSSYVTTSRTRDSVGYDPEVTENEGIGFVDQAGHAIGLNAYVADTDGNLETLADRDIFLQFYDFTDGIFYQPIRLTEDGVEQSYISPLTTMDGAELFFLSGGNIQELNVQHLWETLADGGEGVKTLAEEPVIITAVTSRNAELPITEFVLDTDGYNDFLFWTERSIAYKDGVEPNSEEAALPENQYAQRQIYGAWRSFADAEETVLRDENGAELVYPEKDESGVSIDYSTVPDLNGQVGVVKAGDPVTVLSRTWSGTLQITDEQGANYSDIDLSPLRSSAFCLTYLKGYSSLQTVAGQQVAAEDIQNRSLCVAKMNLEYTDYSVALEPVEALPAAGEAMPLAVQVSNLGFLSDKSSLVVNVYAKVNGGEAELIAKQPVESPISGQSVTLYLDDWTVPEDARQVEFTAQVCSEYTDSTQVYDTDSFAVERQSSVSISVLDSHMDSGSTARVTVRLTNDGDWTAEAQRVTASSGSSQSTSQPVTLLPGESSVITFAVTVPGDAFFQSQSTEDGSVVEQANITLSAGTTPCIATVQRTASAEELAFRASAETFTLTDANGAAVGESLTVSAGQPVTLTVKTPADYDGVTPVLLLECLEGNIQCDGDTLVAEAGATGKVVAYILPYDTASVLGVGGSAQTVDASALLASDAVRAVIIDVTSTSGGGSSGGGGSSSGGSQTPEPPEESQKPEISVTQFTDLDPDAWYYEGVAYTVEQGLFAGTSATAFAPEDHMTRAMVWTVLARLDGQETESGDSWYALSRQWAMDTGISDGANPEATITREQLASMLQRYAAYQEADASESSGSAAAFPDWSSVSSWAQEGMAWAVDTGLLQGTGAGLLEPQGTATRAQVAVMLMRFLQSAKQ